MNYSNNCTKPTPLIQVFARQGKSPSRIREEESIISRMGKIRTQIDKWKKQKNAYLGEDFHDEFFREVWSIKFLTDDFPDVDTYDFYKFAS